MEINPHLFEWGFFRKLMFMRNLTEKDKSMMNFLESKIDTIQDWLILNPLETSDPFTEEEINYLNICKKQLKDPAKNQHYVPQFHLKQFENNETRVETLDLKNKKILKSQSPKHICSDYYFYSLESGKPDVLSQLLE